MSEVLRWQDGSEFWLELDGQRLESRAWGPSPREACTIVLLHEGLGSVRQWKSFPERLSVATGFGVFAYSRQGYGRSSPVRLPRLLDYMTHEAKEVLPQILDAVGVRRVVLVGHSDGASIAAIHAGVCADERLRGVSLIAPHFFTEPSGLAAIEEARTAFKVGDLRDRLAKYQQDVDGAFRGWCDAWLDPDFARWSIEDIIPRLRVPVQAIQGRDDPYGTLAQIKALETGLPCPLSTHILDDCKHAPHLEHAQETLEAITAFVRPIALTALRSDRA